MQSHGVTRAPKERGWLMKLFLGSDKPMDVMAQKFGIGPVSRGSHICWCLAECTHTHCRCLNACTPELLLSHGLRLLDCRCLLTPCMCLMVCTPSLQVLLCVHSHTACVSLCALPHCSCFFARTRSLHCTPSLRVSRCVPSLSWCAIPACIRSL